MCLYYTQWFWATSPWSSVLSGVMCIVGGAPFRSLVGVSSVCMGEGPAKEKTEMRDSIKNRVTMPVGGRSSLPQILGPAPWIWSLACAPAWDGIWCWWSKDRGWEKRSTRLQVWPWDGCVGQKSSCVHVCMCACAAFGWGTQQHRRSGEWWARTNAEWGQSVLVSWKGRSKDSLCP